MTDHHHHLYLSIAEFDIDVGSTVRAQLPSTIPVTGTFLSPMMETKNKNRSLSSSSSSSSSSLPSWSHFLADQMMPDGSDRNSRNTSWVILNRPSVTTRTTTTTTKSEQEETSTTCTTNYNNGRFANNGIKCCVFQMSSIAKWNPRACILSASTDFFSHQNQTQQQKLEEEEEEEEEIVDPVLKVVDLFDFCKDSPTFSFSKQSIEQSAYKPIGRLSTIRVQALGMLPAEKMKKVGEVFNQPPFRSRSDEYSSSSTNFYQQIFLDNNSTTSSTPSILHQQQQRGNSNDNTSSYYCSSSDSSGASLLLSSSSSPKAFANIIGESSSCGIAFLRQQDLEKLVSWIETAKEASKQLSSGTRNDSGNQLDDNEQERQEDHEDRLATENCTREISCPSPLYGTVVTVTKKMETAKRGSVNMSVCLHASPTAVSTEKSSSMSSSSSSSTAKTIQFLRSTRPFLETVAIACCDATAAPTKEEKLERIDKIAKSAYNFLIEQIIPHVANDMNTAHRHHDDKQNHEYSTMMKVQSLAALSKRVTCRNYSEWMRILATDFTCSSSSLTWQDPNVVELLLRENNYNNDENSKPIVPLINPRIIAPSFSRSHHHKGNHHHYYHCDITLPLSLLPPSPLMSFDPSSVWFSYNSSNRHQTRQLLTNEKKCDDTTSGENTTTTSSSSSYYENQHTPLASYHSDRNHLIINLIEAFGTDGLVRILIHILMQRTCLVICRGGGGSRATETVMALASLFDFFDDLFIANRVIPYASVSLLDQIKVMTRSGTGGVLAGTVNPIFESQFGSGFDVLIDMDAKLVKFGGLVVSTQHQQQQQSTSIDGNLSAANGGGRGGHRRQPSSSTVSSSSSGQPQLTTFDCYKHSKSSKKNAFVGGIVPSSSESTSTTTSGQNQQNQNQNQNNTSTTGTTVSHEHQQHPTTTAASSSVITSSSALSSSSSTSTESSKSNLPVVCGGSVIIEKWYEELSNELHTLLLRRKNSSSSSGAAVMAMNYSTSTTNNNNAMMTENQQENLDRKDKDDDDDITSSIDNFFERETVEQVHFEPNCGIEDEIRLTIVQEISVLLWSLARASSTTTSSSGGGGDLLVTDIPFQIAESRIFFLGRWLGRCSSSSSSSSLQQQQLADPISFGFHLCRLLRPLVIASSPYIDHLYKKKQENENSSNNNNKNTTSDLHHDDHHHLLEDELIVSFLQNAVRTTSNWTAEHWLQVTSTSPRVLQVLATLCGHKHSVIRLLASMLLKKMRAAHPAIEQCASVQEIATNLSNCVYHLQSASDAFTKAIDSILATIDSCAAASNNGDTKLGNSSVMFSELSRIRGLDINISKLSDFGHFLANDVASVLEDTARLASSSASSISTDDHGRLLQAATISSILSNLFRLLTEFSRKYPAKEIEKDILNLRQAKPFLIQFCSESFGEFHRLLVSQDDGGSIARGTTTTSSASVGRNNNHNRSDLPPLATTSLATPQNQIAYRQQSQQQQQNTSNNIDENNDISETASNRSKRSGTTKKKKKKRGMKKHATTSLSQHDDDNDDHDNEKDGAPPPPSGSLTVSNLKTQQDFSAASEAKKNKKNKNQAPTSAASTSAVAAPPQLISSGPEFSFVKTFLASSSNDLFLQFDGRGIDSSLPTATRSKYSSIFSSNYLSPISSLLSSRETFISNESTSISVPSFAAQQQQKQQMFFLDLVQKSLCDSILDTEIGMELGLGVSLENSQLQEDPSSSSFALSSSSSQVQQQKQKKVPGWKFPLSSSSSSSLGFGIKEVNLLGGGARSSSQHHLNNNNNNKWISVFGLFASSTSSTRLSFIRQDVFVRSGGASIVEVGFEVSLIVPDSNNSGNGSGTVITFKPCVRVSSASSGNNNDDDPVGLAFVRIMKDVFLATSNQLLQSMNDEYGDSSSSSVMNNNNTKNNNNKPSTTKSLLSLDAHSHQERERKSQQQYSDSQAKKKLEEEERLRLEQEQRDQDGGLVHGTTNVIRSVGNSVFGVVKGVVMTPVNVAGKVAGVAANTVKDQQLALFARNFPEVIEEYKNKNKNNLSAINIDDIVIDLFNCALKDESISLKQGYLYLLKDRCCFCASVLTAKFSIKWRDISSLEKRRYGFFNNSIELMLLNGNSYFLTSFLDRDAALNRIFEFWTGRVV